MGFCNMVGYYSVIFFIIALNLKILMFYIYLTSSLVKILTNMCLYLFFVYYKDSVNYSKIIKMFKK